MRPEEPVTRSVLDIEGRCGPEGDEREWKGVRCDEGDRLGGGQGWGFREEREGCDPRSAQAATGQSEFGF
jgi:hypothetical protein